MNEKLTQFLEAIACENTEGITPETFLYDIDEWDSMGIMNIKALLSTSYNCKITMKDIVNLNTVADVLALMK